MTLHSHVHHKEIYACIPRNWPRTSSVMLESTPPTKRVVFVSSAAPSASASAAESLFDCTNKTVMYKTVTNKTVTNKTVNFEQETATLGINVQAELTAA